MRLPFIQRALANVRYKLTWIGEQKVKLKASYKEFTDVQDEMEKENQMKVRVREHIVARLKDSINKY